MAEKHYYEQIDYTRKYIIPYLRVNLPEFEKMNLLEVGCAEGGLLTVMKALGVRCKGIEIDPKRAETALNKNPELDIVVGDITDPELPAKLKNKYDLIIIREVIEHIRDKEAAFRNLKNLLNDGGFIFISFPPKYSPFAGHQQIAKSFLKFVPYLHLLPAGILRIISKIMKENPAYVDEIKLHFSTGCTVRKLEKLVSDFGLEFIVKEFYLFRPIYNLRFGLPVFKLPEIPLLKEFISFGCESLLTTARKK
ncbi:3-demethylubiquinone-9 3-methyltransferase [Melioribacter roseus P3M-2]|uniref:3-demethylubiquinone-9 3-methyltransferase n=1 Tax=Melioribacter roseus (strain DSM 23840 / JCM 17771 / VKM B-2668 / P3M-2) TaxID=1191523 RepID=I6ZUV9_MELRP|nr:class I SAM-dependent methyltransferase [Melioribacter roseus]AFN75814.1 3-demethylubiquinone-9 3-methyltransferase [Melioribacter roseus P3M-2]